MLPAHISLTCRAHGTEDGTTYAVDRPRQEGGLRAPLRAPGPDTLAGGAPTHTRLPDPSRCDLRAERLAEQARARSGCRRREAFARRDDGCGESAQTRLSGSA